LLVHAYNIRKHFVGVLNLYKCNVANKRMLKLQNTQYTIVADSVLVIEILYRNPRLSEQCVLWMTSYGVQFWMTVILKHANKTAKANDSKSQLNIKQLGDMATILCFDDVIVMSAHPVYRKRIL